MEHIGVAETGSGHHILLDDAVGATGAKPIELVAVALAGCTAFNVITHPAPETSPKDYWLRCARRSRPGRTSTTGVHEDEYSSRVDGPQY
jgi:hypothetical protein